MDEIDQLLAGINPTVPAQKSTPPVQQLGPAVTGSIEDLLGQLDESTKLQVRQRLSHDLHYPPSDQPPSHQPPSRSANSAPPKNLPPMDYLLTEVQQAQAELAAAEQLRQAEIEREQAQQARLKQQRLDQLRAQRREELRQTAEQWLKRLKPKSDEGRWFEEFACNYASRLEAAIDYLEALEEVNALHPDR